MDKPKGRNKDEENEFLIVGYQNGEKCDNGSPSSAENEQVDAWIREVDQIFIKTILKGWEVNSRDVKIRDKVLPLHLYL